MLDAGVNVFDSQVGVGLGEDMDDGVSNGADSTAAVGRVVSNLFAEGVLCANHDP